LADWSRAPERFGRPVRIAALADPLRVSGETVRRHLNRLETLGFCSRRPGGVVAIAPASAWPQLARFAQVNQANVQRLFARLRQLGTLVGWDVPGARDAEAAPLETITLPSDPAGRNTRGAGEVTGAREWN
jgi:DNA-binding IclR family transcriptional regulator